MKSHISNQELDVNEAISASEIKLGIYNLIKNQFPNFDSTCFISNNELNQFRRLYMSSLIASEKGDLEEIDIKVMEAIKNNSLLSEMEDEEDDETLTFGQKMADKIAVFGGSWTFIIAFFSFILLWILVNIWVLTTKPFDPFPFILLNLILSCLASIQAPIIMMSQNRQEQKDRKRGEQDYKINLKAELEIKILSEKLDHLLVHQNKKLLEIQETQTDYLEELIKQKK